MNLYFYLIFVALFISQHSKASTDVKELCSKTGLPVFELEYRNREANIQKIRTINLGTSKWSKDLKKYYAQKVISKDENLQVIESNELNLKNQKKSKAAKLALNWAGREKREKDPVGYIESIATFIGETIPSLKNKIVEFLKYKHSDLKRSEIIPASPTKRDFYGARGGIYQVVSGNKLKEVRMVKISNNPSENFPYLAALIGHEIVHAEDSFKDRKYLNKSSNIQWAEWSLLNEAKAYEQHFQYYIEGVKNAPELFCNWLYPTWSYGEIIVPLSWVMHSMIKEAQRGKLIHNQLKLPLYSPFKEYLYGKGKNTFNSMLKKVRDSQYRYVK